MRLFTKIILSAVLLLLSAVSYAAQTQYFKISQGPDPILQGDERGDLSFTVIGTWTNPNIMKVHFEFDSTKYIICSYTAPDPWTGTILATNIIEFQTTSGGIDKNNAETFVITVTGVSGNIPNASGDDSTHALTKITAFDGSGNAIASDPGGVGQTYWLRRGLYTELYIDPQTLLLGKNATFYLRVQNRTNASQTVTPILPSRAPDNLKNTYKGNFQFVSGPSPSTQTLAPGEIKEFTYVYKAVTNGNVSFQSGAKNGTAITSNICISNEVSIQILGGYLEVPANVGNGESFSVAYHAINNSTSQITNLKPQALSFTKISGTISSHTLVSGPNPSGPVVSLDPGSEIVFYWQYKVTGDSGSLFKLSSQVISDQENTIRDQSDASMISTFNATLTPDQVSTGDTGVKFSFTIFNGGGTNDAINQVVIKHPDTILAKTPDFFVSSSPSGGNVSPWNYSLSSTAVTFTPKTGDQLKGGKQMTLYLTYNIPDKSWYPSETPKKFELDITGTVSGKTVTEYKVSSFLISQNNLDLVVTPQTQGDLSPYDADGVKKFDVVAKFTQSGNPVTGKTISFDAAVDASLDLVVPPELSPLSAVTKDGFATVTLTAPLYQMTNPSQFNVKLTASYQTLKTTNSSLAFKYYTGPSLRIREIKVQKGATLDLVGNFQLIPGDTGVSFQPLVENMAATNFTVYKSLVRNGQTYYTTFQFKDASDNGVCICQAKMTSTSLGSNGNSLSIPFEQVQIPPGMIYGVYIPTLTLEYKDSSGTYREAVLYGEKNNLSTLDQRVHIGSRNQGIKIVNWREKQEAVN